MKCCINGNLRDIKAITYRDLGFNQKLTNREALSYIITLNINEFISIMEEPFNDFVNESREDDEITGNDDTLGLLELEYPNFLIALYKHKNFLEQFIRKYLFFELLDGCLIGRNRMEWDFAINSVKNIIIGNDIVEITGEMYRIE